MGLTVQRQQYEPEKWSKRFYYSKMINGQLARFPLSVEAKKSESLAEQIAGFLMDPTKGLLDAKRKFNPRALARPSDFSTVGELLDFHRNHWKVLELKESTGKDYASCLLVIMRQVDAWRRGTSFQSWGGMRNGREERMAPWIAKSLTEINAKLATDYKRLMVPQDLEDEEEELTQKITADTNLRSARSLFSKDAMQYYKRSDGLVLPDLTEFMAVRLYGAKKYFVLQPVSVIRTIFTAAPVLKAKDLNAYRAFLLCVQAGLRKSEASSLRMDWLQEEDIPAIHIHTDGAFKPKHGHGRKVLLDTWVAGEMRSLASQETYFIDGKDTERTDEVFARLNLWLRTCGVDSSKPTHELRKLWFSQKSKRESLQAAAEQGGHRDPKITTSFYSSSLLPDNVLAFWKEPTLVALATAGLRTA
jgi:integrase